MTTTTNYKLPIVSAQDKASWLTTFNESMNSIDSVLKKVEASIPSGDYTGQINKINENIASLQTDITNIKTALNKLVNVVVVNSTDGTGITAQEYSNLTTVSATVN